MAGIKEGIPPLNRSDIRVAEASFRLSVPRLKMASTVARSESWEYWTPARRVRSGI
jgi:hypothetical protein